MFYRRWEGLPKDPIFGSNLKELGYFVNEEDEVRSIEDPQYYFKYRLDKNERINERQRFDFNMAVQDVVHERLENEGLIKHYLPFNACPHEPRVPIFASKDLKDKSRVVIIFGEECQQLGHIALRVANGRGGINKGSMVSVVQALAKQASSGVDSQPPGIILANTGERFLEPTRKRMVTINMHSGMPAPSMVHYGQEVTRHCVARGHASIFEHIHYVFNEVLPRLTRTDCQIDLIGIGDGGEELERFLDDGGFTKHGHRISTLTLLGTFKSIDKIQDKSFRSFLANRARAWINSREPLGTPLADCKGNPNTKTYFTYHGTAGVFSAGEPWHIELILIEAFEEILRWPEAVAKHGSRRYKHPRVKVTFSDPDRNEIDWSEWSDESTKGSKGKNNAPTRSGTNGHLAKQDMEQAVEQVGSDADAALRTNGDGAKDAQPNGKGVIQAGTAASESNGHVAKQDVEQAIEQEQVGDDAAIALRVGGDGAQDEQPNGRSVIQPGTVASGSNEPRARPAPEQSHSKCGLNFYAEDGDKTASSESEHNEPASRPTRGERPAINFFADVSDSEADGFDDMDPETKEKLNQALERFQETGSLMDPREVERIEAEIEDEKDGITGMY